MLDFHVIGNLGADARVESKDGRSFTVFNVADSSSYVGEDGVRHESTQWVSCILDGDGGRLLPYLKKGKTVYVMGRGSARVFSSERERRMMAGLNLSVRRIELIGGQVDPMPRRLVAPDGLLLDVYKAYYIDGETAKKLRPNAKTAFQLATEHGELYQVGPEGWVTTIPDATEPNNENQVQN